MATTGTVATTVIDTASLLDHACRRAGIPAERQTPEIVSAAKESIYMLLLGLSNKGYNLWCVEKFYQGLIVGKTTYDFPDGTLTLVSAHFSKPSLVSSSQSATTLVTTTTLTTQSTVARVGLKFSSVTATDTVTVEASTDNISWTTLAVKVGDLQTDSTIWIQPAIVSSYLYVRATTLLAAVCTMYIANGVSDLPMAPWSRDQYQNLNNKFQSGSPSTNYYFERTLPPKITIWPVPTVDTDHLTLIRHRQIQDVGTLSNQLEVPQRWLESITWQSALRIAVETPGVDPTRIQLCKQMADEHTIEVENDETDGMPVSIAPNVSVYTS